MEQIQSSNYVVEYDTIEDSDSDETAHLSQRVICDKLRGSFVPLHWVSSSSKQRRRQLGIVPCRQSSRSIVIPALVSINLAVGWLQKMFVAVCARVRDLGGIDHTTLAAAVLPAGLL